MASTYIEGSNSERTGAKNSKFENVNSLASPANDSTATGRNKYRSDDIITRRGAEITGIPLHSSYRIFCCAVFGILM